MNTTTPTLVQPNPAQWDPDVAIAAAEMAEEVAGRLSAVLVLLDHVQHHEEDEGWTISTIRDLIAGCQTDLRTAVTGGAR
jgi:hypothetical protein